MVLLQAIPALRSVVHSPNSLPSLMPTIHDLPLENIGRIITIAYRSNPPGGGDEWRARRAFLRATSLVCRDWTPFAQVELWKIVYLSNMRAFERFATAGPGRYPVRSLVLVQNRLSDARLADDILLRVRGVRELAVMMCLIDSRCLCGPGLRGKSRRRGHFLRY